MTLSHVLAIETSSRTGSVALMHDNRTIREEALGEGAFQGKTLAPNVDALLKTHGISPDEVDLVAVGLGPGSFTGLRVGIAFARSFAYAVGCPVVGVSSLAALALSRTAEDQCEEIFCISKAGYEEFFYASFLVENQRVTSRIEHAVGSLDLVREKAVSFKIVAGEGADLVVPGAEAIVPAAGSVAEIGVQMYAEEGPTPDDRLLPLYLRRSNAEINWERRQQDRPG